MEKEPQSSRSIERWAHFRFSVIGPLLAAPPPRGRLQDQLQQLAAQKWRHPLTGHWVLLGFSTIERWYYKALRSKTGPVEELKRKVRSDHGKHPALGAGLAQLLVGQHQQHPSWSYQLHADNLAVLVEQKPQLGPMPSYASVLRFMKSHGLFKRPRRGPVAVQVSDPNDDSRGVGAIFSEERIGVLEKALRSKPSGADHHPFQFRSPPRQRPAFSILSISSKEGASHSCHSRIESLPNNTLFSPSSK
jgi:hypothetical protein